MKLQFTKMHGAGNDFIVIDAINQDIAFTPAQWQRLADRRFGIGADQILVVEKPRLPGCDFRYRIYNNDGGEVEQCGNGARAFVKFVSEKGLSDKASIRVETMAGIIAPRLELDGSITVDMGAPVLEPALVPFDAAGLDGVAEGNDTLWPLDLALPGQTAPVLVSVVSMGNPHAVQVVEDVDAQDLEQSGPLIEHHPRFPRRVNAGYLQIIDRHHVKLRVYERGAGETLACGTGACAAAVAGIIAPRLELDGSITVDMGAPVLEPALVPFDAAGLDGVAQGTDLLWPLDLALPGHTAPVLVSVVSMGNPHAVQVVDDVDAQDLEVTGPRIEHHPRFPRRVNAGYMQVVDRQHVKLRVYERGAGETLACGTGACAAAVAGIRRGLLDSPVRISARGGELSIAWQGPGHPVLMTGPAVTVFEGTIEL